MFNIGGLELLVILAVALLVLGPDKLPGFMRSAGKTLGQFRKASTEFQRTMNVDLAEEEAERAELPAANETATPDDAAAAPSAQTADEPSQNLSAAAPSSRERRIPTRQRPAPGARRRKGPGAGIASVPDGKSTKES